MCLQKMIATAPVSSFDQIQQEENVKIGVGTDIWGRHSVRASNDAPSTQTVCG